MSQTNTEKKRSVFDVNIRKSLKKYWKILNTDQQGKQQIYKTGGKIECIIIKKDYESGKLYSFLLINMKNVVR